MAASPHSREPLKVGLITLGWIVILSAAAFLTNGGNPLVFAHIGTRFSERNPNGTVGYDGQFAYFIARDGAAAIPYIDGPTLRYQRIVYPLVSRALALGNPDLVPWTLILVNLAAFSAGAGLLAYLLNMLGGPPRAALIYTFWIGGLFSVRLDLHEPLCMALGIAAVIAYLRGRFIGCILLLMLSTLTKELGLIFAAGIALHALAQRRLRWASLLFGGPLLLFLAWWGVMRLWLGAFPTRYPAGKIHLLPLQGMFTESSTVEFVFLAIWLGLPAVTLLLAAIHHIWRTRSVHIGASLVTMGAGFVLVMPDVSWQDPAAAYRVGMPLIAAAIVFIGECYPKRWKFLAALWMPAVIIILLIPRLWF